MPADVEASQYGQRLSALVGLLGSAFPVSFSTAQTLLDQRQGRAPVPRVQTTVQGSEDEIKGYGEKTLQGACDRGAEQSVFACRRLTEPLQERDKHVYLA